jgi:hypothetical protein
MFVYLDESGDAGFKFRQNSSRYFVVTLLLVDDPLPLQVAIDDLRKQLGFAEGNEFKFSSSSAAVRHAFLRMMLHQDFAVRALIVDKMSITHGDLKQREPFYQRMVRLVLEHDDKAISDAMLILDESVKSRQTKNELTTYLRRSLNTIPNLPTIRTIRYHSSRADSLIQATDMISGAIYAAYHRHDDSYLRLIHSKIHDLWELDATILEAQ